MPRPRADRRSSAVLRSRAVRRSNLVQASVAPWRSAAVILNRHNQGFAVEPCAAFAAAQTSLAVPADRQRVDVMFLGLNPRREGGLIIAGAHLHPGLDDGGTPVEFRRDEMHGGAVDGI